MFDHERCQFGAVDENKACVDAVGGIKSVRAEARGGDEDPAAGLGAVQRSDEGLDVRPPYVTVGVALGPMTLS